MIRQYDAQKLCDDKLKELGLFQKGWRTCFDKSQSELAKCWYDEKRIQISLIYLNGCSEPELKKTVIHECAHALLPPEHGHDRVWFNKCIELGDNDPKPCGRINFGGRAIQPSESKPKRQFHRLDKVCPICGKKAIETSRALFGTANWTKLECGHLVKSETIKSSGFDFDTWESASGKKPFHYQIEGIKFLESAGGRALIADEPGLGKTIQAIGFALAHEAEVTPILWVCKTTLKLQASKEFVDWAGPAWMAQIITSPRNFIMPGLKVYIISMDLLRNMPTEKIDSIGFKTVVADEIQHFKNPDSTRTAELRKLVTKAEYFIPLSGTPWKNRGQEYFPVLNMLDPIRFSSYENFKNRWVDVYLDTQTMKYRQGGIKNIPAFREYTKDMVIRRMRDDVQPDLPKINRQIRYVDMGALYAKAYEDMEVKVANYIKEAYLGDNVNMRLLATEMMKLKHLTGLAKVGVAIEDAIEFLENSEDADKLVIFHHHIDVGDHLQKGDHAKTFEGLDDWLVKNGYNKTLRLFGGRSADERDEIQQRFKNDIRNRICIASTLASGEGLNLQFCQNVMQIERQWNPQNEEQAELRFSRPLTRGDLPPYLQDHLLDAEGKQKKKSIRVPYFIADGTIDTMLTGIVERKRTNFNKSMNKGQENIKWEENEIMNELAQMIMKKRFGNKTTQIVMGV